MDSDKTAAEILRASIADIDAGLWICGSLLDYQKKWDPKPMGCAIGLVGINSGAAKMTREGSWSLNYPDRGSGGWTSEAKLAVKFLAKASSQPQPVRSLGGLGGLAWATGAVIEENDSECSLPREARAWFVKALELAEAAEMAEAASQSG